MSRTVRRTFGYAGVETKPDALAERHTRKAEAQDISGLARPVFLDRIADEDRTLTGGYLNEEVVEALRTGMCVDVGVAEAARNFNAPWLLDETSLPQE